MIWGSWVPQAQGSSMDVAESPISVASMKARASGEAWVGI